MLENDKSALLCIGINTYKNRHISTLYCCINDCHRVKKIFSIFNICSKSTLITDNNATFTQILSKLSAVKNKVKKIFIYYSGHGTSINNSSYIYAYDTDPDDIRNTAISLEKLAYTLKMFGFIDVVFIIDACYILPLPGTYNTFTLYTPGQRKTLEDTSIKNSIFTKIFLKTIIKKYKTHYVKSLTRRYQKLRRSIEIILHDKNDLIFLIGQSGIGKSHFLRQIKDSEDNVFYLSLPNKKGLTFEVILNILSETISSTLEPCSKMLDADPEKYIRFKAQTHSHYLLLIDHLDHLRSTTLRKLIVFLQELPLQKILSSRTATRNKFSGYIYQMPKLSNVDINEALSVMGIRDKTINSLCHKHSGGNYIHLLRIISEHSAENYAFEDKFTTSIKKAMLATVISGGFINQDLFEKIFGICHQSLEHLKKLGIIILHNGFYYPHDSAYESTKHTEIKAFKYTACQYWRAEINKNESSITAIHNYILLSNSFSITVTPSDTLFYKNIIKKLEGRQNTYFLLMIFKHLKSKKIREELRLYLSDVLINIGKFNEALSLLTNQTEHVLEYKTLLAEVHWWKGEFVESIKLSTKLLSKKPTIPIKANLLSIRGIGYFFLGKWSKAASDLTDAIYCDSDSTSQKSIFLAYCVLATIQGLRGTDFYNSVINFKHAVRVAKKSGKLFLLALAYGNIGEILWKAGFHEQSITLLETGRQLAYITDNSLVDLEINRNLLHAYHRAGKLSKEKEQLKKLETIFNEKTDSYVKMQIINTLVTHYIIYGKKEYRKYLKKAQEITTNNSEYFIYTKANIALEKICTNDIINATISMTEALMLCRKGKNWLAMKQILDDWDDARTKLDDKTIPESKQVFQKWRQMLERKLLPYLSHLLHLCEYLGLP